MQAHSCMIYADEMKYSQNTLITSNKLRSSLIL